MHVEGLLPANLCLVTLLSSEKSLQFEKFHLQHVQMVNKSRFKAKLTGNNAELTAILFDVSLSHILDNRLPVKNYWSANFWHRSWHPPFKVICRELDLNEFAADREFQMAEIEHFCDPKDKSHPKFDAIKDVSVPLYSACAQMDGQLPQAWTFGDAVEKVTRTHFASVTR